MGEVLTWGVRLAPDKPLAPISEVGELHAALKVPGARVVKTHLSRARKRQVIFSVDGRRVAPQVVKEAVERGHLQPQGGDLFGDTDNPQSWGWRHG
jgi:hypothetical protein